MRISDTIVVALIAASSAAVAASISSYFNYMANNRTLDGKLVEIGINILAADPAKADVAPARQWAIELVETHAGKRFSDEDRKALLYRRIGTCQGGGGQLDFSDPATAGNSAIP